MNIRAIEAKDQDLLVDSLSKDKYHSNTPPEFFYAPGTLCNVYELNDKPVMFVRATKALRIDIQFVDNDDYESNRQVLTEGFEAFAARAKAAGFTELIFNSDSPLLRAFCKRKFGFHEVSGELRRFL